MDSKLRETICFFFGFFSVDSCSSVLWLWGIAISCLESLETLLLSALCSFPDTVHMQSARGCYEPTMQSHFSRLFCGAEWEGLKHLWGFSFEVSGEDSSGPWLRFDRDLSQNSLVETEFYVLNLSSACLRVSPQGPCQSHCGGSPWNAGD